MTDKQFNWWIFGVSCASGLSLGTAIMGLVDTIKDNYLERKIDRMREANCCKFDEIRKGHEELMKQFDEWNKANKKLLEQAMKETKGA